MPPVGRPSSRTVIGERAPINELGYPDLYLTTSGSSDPLRGLNLGWHDFADVHEFVPELQWPLNIQVYDQMRTDSQLAALWTAVAWGIRQLRIVLDPNGARPGMVTEISEDLNVPIMGEENQPRRRMKHRFSEIKHRQQSMLAILYGHMYFEQFGDIVDGKWRLRKLAPRMPQSIQNINVADDGGLISIRQYPNNSNFLRRPMGQGPEIPVDRLLGMIFEQEGANWVGRSMFRDCWKNWLIKDRLMRVDAVNHERAGGIPYAEGAPGMNSAELAELNILMQSFRTGDMSGMALPSGATLKIAKGTGSDVVKSWHAHDEAMARRFLLMLMNLAQGGQHVGSYGMAESFQDTWFIGQRTIVQWYCDMMTEHVIEDWVDWNYGEDEELTPVLTWERASEDSLSTEALAMMVDKGVIVMDDETEDWVRYRQRMPKRTEPRPKPVDPSEAGATKPPGAAPSQAESAPATKASFPYDWETADKPHVMAAAGEPVLVTVPNVPILEAGVEYQLSTGPTTFTPEDLRDCVTAANEDFSIPAPRLKIGHIDPRYNSNNPFDGSPAFGSARNLRLGENGMVVYADYVGVPKWLANVMATAYPNRSIEGFWNVESQSGHRWKFVLSAVALLGVVWPGVTVLEDLPQYFGEEMPADVELVTAATGGDAMDLFRRKKSEAGTTASANLDDVRRAFYNDYVPEHQSEGTLWWWIRAVLTDPNELVVEDDDDGQLYKLSFSSGDKGDVSFGDPEAVRIDYIPDNRESKKAAASHVAATLAIGRHVMASYESRAESAPADSPETRGGAMDPKELRERLGLAEDASDAEVQTAVAELAGAAGLSAPAVPGANSVQPQGGVTPVGTGGVEPEDPANPPQPTPEPQRQPTGTPASQEQQAAAASSGLPAGMVLIDEGTLATLTAGAQAGLEVKASSELDRNKREVAAAVADGRIPPARAEHWEGNLKTDYEGFATVLASMPKGVIPVSMRGNAGETGEIGHGGGGEVQVAATAELVDSWTNGLFPEVAAARSLEAKVRENGARAYPRVMGDTLDSLEVAV